MRTMAAAIVAFGLLGCGGPMTMMMRTPEYELGYSEGCNSAAQQSSGRPQTPTRNEMLYSGNEDYRRGWNSGNVQCRPQAGPNRL